LNYLEIIFSSDMYLSGVQTCSVRGCETQPGILGNNFAKLQV